MAVSVGIVSAAHVHAPSFAACFAAHSKANLAGVWDDDVDRGKNFAEKFSVPFVADLTELLQSTDAAVICSENLKHGWHLSAALEASNHVLCEKPIAGSQQEWDLISSLPTDRVMATAFPCPFSPGFKSLQDKVSAGAIGKVLAVSATNQGTCPFGWFTDPALSGGGAMIDHVVHVADLLRRLLGEQPTTVQAQTGNNMYGLACDDTAMVTVRYPSGVFATIDASWSKPKGYKTWGNVRLNVTGEKGVIELDMFAQGFDVYTSSGHQKAGAMSNLDALMVDDFLTSIETGKPPVSSLSDGLAASKIALSAYESAGAGNMAVPLG